MKKVTMNLQPIAALLLLASLLTPYALAQVTALEPATPTAAPVSYPHATEPIGTVREIYDGVLSPEMAVNTFRNIDRLFPTRTRSAFSDADAVATGYGSARERKLPGWRQSTMTSSTTST